MSKDNTQVFYTMTDAPDNNIEKTKPGTETFNAEAREKILGTRGVWAPAQKIPEETDLISGADTIKCIKLDFWDQ